MVHWLLMGGLFVVVVVVVVVVVPRSVAAGFSRCSAVCPRPASNDTGTALDQHGSDWWRDLATYPTLTFDLGGHGACGWCGSSSSIRVPSVKFVDLAVRKIMAHDVWALMGLVTLTFDLETGVLVASVVGNLPSKFGHARPLNSRIIRYVRDGRTDNSNSYCPFPKCDGIIKCTHYNNTYTHISDI